MQANNYSQFMKFEQNVCKNNAYLSAFYAKIMQIMTGELKLRNFMQIQCNV